MALPNSGMQLSAAGLDAIKRRECPPPDFDYVLKAYRDGAGVWTIGAGHTDPSINESTIWTREQGAQALLADAGTATSCVANNVEVPLTQDQFDALCSLVYNIGAAAFTNSSLLKQLNSGSYAAVPAQMRLWTKSRDPSTGKVVPNPGLVNRRNSEIGQWTRGASVSSATVIPEPPPSLSANVKAKAAAAGAALAGAGAGISQAVGSAQAQAQAAGHWGIAAWVALGIGVICAIAAHVFSGQSD